MIGTFGAAVTSLLTAFPKELVVAIAGLALLGSIGGGLAAAMKEPAEREAALITFLVTLSGVTLAGIGSAFWGIVAGALALFVQQYAKPRTADPAPAAPSTQHTASPATTGPAGPTEQTSAACAASATPSATTTNTATPVASPS